MCVFLSVCDYYMSLGKHACIYRHTGEILMVAHLYMCVCTVHICVWQLFWDVLRAGMQKNGIHHIQSVNGNKDRETNMLK